MIMRCLRRALFVAALLSLFGAQSANATNSLARLTIRLSDLRPGYEVLKAGYHSRLTIARHNQIGDKLLLSHGWVDGFDALYQRRDNPRVQVGEVADRFKSAHGAHWWYGVSLLRVPSDYRPIKLPHVGTESTAVQSKVYAGIIFRRDRTVMDVYVSLVAPQPRSSVLALARLVDRRLWRDQREATAGVRTQRGPMLKAWVSPNPMQYDAYPILYAKASPGARCSASVIYSTGYRPRSLSGGVQTAGPHGVVSWSWHELVRGVHGKGTVTCAFHGHTRTAVATFSVAG